MLSFMLSCTTARAAVAQATLQFVTDSERLITHDALLQLQQMLRWCGESVRVLCLDQPRYFMFASGLDV